MFIMRNQGVYTPVKKKLQFHTRKTRKNVTDSLEYNKTFIQKLGENTRVHAYQFVESDI